VKCRASLDGDAHVHDEKLDPRPDPDQFVRALAARAAEGGPAGVDPTSWLRSWNDREDAWTNLRNLEHWLARAGA
jgi:hypothetical protein